MKIRFTVAIFAFVLFIILPVVTFADSFQTIEKVSLGLPFSEESDNFSVGGSVSADGRYVVFTSMASNLTQDGNNGYSQVYLYDTQTFAYTLVSKFNSQMGNGQSGQAMISADGRYVVFYSTASNLGFVDTNGSAPDIFIYDTLSEEIIVNSFGITGFVGAALSPSVSADGNRVVFRSGVDNQSVPISIYMYEMDLDQFSVVSINNEGDLPLWESSESPSISPNGRYVAFISEASNLVPGMTGGTQHVFVRDLQEGETFLASQSSLGDIGNSGSSLWISAVSDNGRVVFESGADNLVPNDENGVKDIFVRDIHTGNTERVSVGDLGAESNNMSLYPSISADGRYVVFSSNASNLVSDFDTENISTIFMYDLQTGVTTRISRSFDSQNITGAGYAQISSSGLFVVFGSDSDNIVEGDTNGVDDVFLFDIVDQSVIRVSAGPTILEGENNGDSQNVSISADGRFIAFESGATNLVPNDTNGNRDIFVHDRVTGETTRVSVDSQGGESNGFSYYPSISADGRFIAFESGATNLVPNDTNGNRDIFVHDRVTGETTRVSVDSQGGESGVGSFYPSISADGRFVVFVSSGEFGFSFEQGVSLPRLWLHDRDTGSTTLVQDFDNLSIRGLNYVMSSDANFFVMHVTERRFVHEYYLYNRVDDTLTLLPFPDDDGTTLLDISNDGKYIVFSSENANLVSNDTNGNRDIFVYNTVNETFVRASVNSQGGELNAESWSAAMTPDGRYLAFDSYATNVTSQNTKGFQNVFLAENMNWVSVVDEIEGVVPVRNTPRQSSGGSIQQRISNLVDMGKEQEANQLKDQFPHLFETEQIQQQKIQSLLAQIEQLKTLLAQLTNNTLSPQTLVCTPSLRRGDTRRDQVRLLQQKLGIISDGLFGPNTETAVRNFQTAKSLIVDGMAGNQTCSALSQV